MSRGGNVVTDTARSEHIGPEDTGDNISAKKVAGYSWDGTNWRRQATPFINVPFDDIQVTYPTASSEVYSYYFSEELVAEVTVTYDDSTKAVLTRVQRTS